jgi:hypothetical protein
MEWFKAAAEQVRREAAKYPEIGIPVDPDVADFMGAFEDPGLTDDDWNDRESIAILAGLEAEAAEAPEKDKGR